MFLSNTTPTYSLLVYEMTIFRNSIQSGTEIYGPWRKSEPWWYFGRIVQIKNTRVWKLKNVLEKYDLEIHLKKWGLDITNWKVWWKEVSKQEIRNKNFGDLITADHKVLSDNCESRNNHRYAVVVQDPPTQWIQTYPCKNKTPQETPRSLQKFLEPKRKPKVIYTDNSLEFGKACEDLPWNHCTCTPHRSEINGNGKRAVRRVKKGIFAVLLQSSLNESWWADSMQYYTYLRNVQDLLSDGKTPYERRFWATI